MIIKDALNKISRYIREGELTSCPYLLLEENKIKLAVFTYFADEDNGLKIFGLSQEIICDGERVDAIQKELFTSEDEVIVINNYNIVSVEERDALYLKYYEALQDFADLYEEKQIVENTECVKNTFKQLVPTEALELYKRCCNGFLEMFSIC